MAEDRLQQSRFELKYVLCEDQALAVRQFVRSYLEMDEFGADKPNFSYPVHSLYLDNNKLALFRGTVDGEKNRFKLRLRYYDSRPNSPVFFEIKRRMNSTILKERGGVRRESVGLLLSGQLPQGSHLLKESPRQMVALQRFCQLMGQLHATPKVHVFYMREAWISTRDNSIRVTMDRQVLCELDKEARLDVSVDNAVNVFGKSVILELKFTNRFPDWFRDLVRVFGLVQSGAAKYVGGVNLIGEGKMRCDFGFDQPKEPFKIKISPVSQKAAVSESTTD
jgi:hypothetical protein